MQICGYLRCRLTKNSPRRTASTPAGVFCTLLASASSISKGLRRVCFTICRCCAQINPQRIRTATDGGGSTQKRVRLRTRSPKIDKEVNFWARMAVVPRSSEFACKLVAQECTRRFILERGRRWFNCLNLGRALPTVL